MINILIILLYAIGNQFEISLIGQMSISDIAVLLFFLYLPTNRKMVEKLLDDKDIIHIVILYLFLVIIQIASETILNNSFEIDEQLQTIQEFIQDKKRGENFSPLFYLNCKLS